MARHNAYIVLSNITEQLGNEPAGEDQLFNMACITKLKDSKTPEVAQKSIKLLREAFPFLKFYYDAEKARIEKAREKKSREKNTTIETLDEREVYYNILYKLLKQLNSFRNEFTHADAEETDFTARRNAFFDMERIFEAAIRRIIEIRNFKENDVLHLKKYNGSEKVNGKLQPKPNAAFKLNFLSEEKNRYELPGLAFFICLFLEKSYGYKFLKQLKGFKASNTNAFKATTEAFTIFYIRLPKQRINQTISSPISLALDMFNELKKCPSNLYDLLSKEDAETFRVQSDDEQVIADDDVEQDILMKRFEDRFPFFALQYIDQNHLFQNIRFHIEMGNYVHAVYDNKHSADGENRIRRLKKNLKTFARLQDLNDLRLEKWKHIIKDKPMADDREPYMTDTYPHYHLERNVIGLKITELPLLNLPHCPPPSFNQKPDFWLSVYELPAMLFLMLMEQRKGNRSLVEDVLLQYRQHSLELLKDVHAIRNSKHNEQQLKQLLQERYHLEIANLPKNIVSYLKGKDLKQQAAEDFVKHAEEKIKKLIADTIKRKDKINDDLDWLGKGKKAGKRGWVEIKSGVIGDFLAKDMMLFQPSVDGKGKDKITGQNFQILQAALAYFGRDKHLLANIFKNCGLTHSNNPHPFLAEIYLQRHSDIVSFYKEYLHKRLQYLKHCSAEKDYTSYHFLRPNISKWKTPAKKFGEKEIQDRLLKNTIALPRGIFKDALVNWFKNNGSESMKAVAMQPRANAVYLIQQYFKLERSADEHQHFYNYERTYHIINKMLDNRTGKDKYKPLEKHFYDTASKEFNQLMKIRVPQELRQIRAEKDREKIKQTFNRLDKNEKLIRLQKAEDMLLFLMAKNMLFGKVAKDVELNMANDVFQLKNMHPKNAHDNATTTLNLQIPFQAEYQVYATDAKNIKRLSKLHTVIIYQEKLKAKNYGDFVKFTKDRRLNNLFMWLPPNSKVERSLLQKELDNYDNQRLLVFEALHKFENLAAAKTGKVANGKSLFDEILQAFYAAYPQFAVQESTITAIRNAFAHNQYPQPKSFANNEAIALQLPQIAHTIAQQGIAMFENYTTILNA